jgi:hypothetical protein
MRSGRSVNAHMFPGYLRSAANGFMRFEMRFWSLIVSIVAAGVCGMMSHRRFHVKATLCCLKKTIQLVHFVATMMPRDCLSSDSSMSCTFMVCLLLRCSLQIHSLPRSQLAMKRELHRNSTGMRATHLQHRSLRNIVSLCPLHSKLLALDVA